MEIQVTEIEWMSVRAVTIEEFAQASGLAVAEIEELVACGLLDSQTTQAGSRAFAARRIPLASRAHRVRRDFELDLRGLAITFRLLERIEELESALSRSEAAL